jgi:cobalt/nickel transport system permease protein
MRHNFLDRYSRTDSPVHRLQASVKMSAALLLVVAAVAVPPTGFLYFAGTAILLILVAALSRIPFPFLIRRLLFLEPLALGVAVLALLRPGGWPVFAGIMMKSSVSLFAMILLSNTTPFTDILAVLRRLRLPAVLISILALMYRYLFVLIDETERMRRARDSRSPGGNRSARWRAYAGLIGQLFVRSTERAERIYAAMCARGWQ